MPLNAWTDLLELKARLVFRIAKNRPSKAVSHSLVPELLAKRRASYAMPIANEMTIRTDFMSNCVRGVAGRRDR